jgi:hypothetical protein
MLETTYKNSKVIINIMERMSVIHLKIKKCRNKVHQHITKEQLQYLKAKDRKVH